MRVLIFQALSDGATSSQTPLQGEHLAISVLFVVR